jgi:hypothetical protein
MGRDSGRANRQPRILGEATTIRGDRSSVRVMYLKIPWFRPQFTADFANFLSFRQKCPKLSRKCPTFFGHIVSVSFVFIYIPASNVNYLFFLQDSLPDLPKSIDKAAHWTKIGVLHGKHILPRSNSPFPAHGVSPPPIPNPAARSFRTSKEHPD